MRPATCKRPVQERPDYEEQQEAIQRELEAERERERQRGRAAPDIGFGR